MNKIHHVPGQFKIYLSKSTNLWSQTLQKMNKWLVQWFSYTLLLIITIFPQQQGFPAILLSLTNNKLSSWLKVNCIAPDGVIITSFCFTQVKRCVIEIQGDCRIMHISFGNGVRARLASKTITLYLQIFADKIWKNRKITPK